MAITGANHLQVQRQLLPFTNCSSTITFSANVASLSTCKLRIISSES